MNDELKKIIEESSKSEYTIEVSKQRISNLNKLKSKHPEHTKAWDGLIEAHNTIIKLKDEKYT